MDRFSLDLEYIYRGKNTSNSYGTYNKTNGNTTNNRWSVKSPSIYD